MAASMEASMFIMFNMHVHACVYLCMHAHVCLHGAPTPTTNHPSTPPIPKGVTPKSVKML